MRISCESRAVHHPRFLDVGRKQAFKGCRQMTAQTVAGHRQLGASRNQASSFFPGIDRFEFLYLYTRIFKFGYGKILAPQGLDKGLCGQRSHTFSRLVRRGQRQVCFQNSLLIISILGGLSAMNCATLWAARAASAKLVTMSLSLPG